MKGWKIISESGIKNQESGIKDLIEILLSNRGLKTKKEIEEFLNPKLENVTIKNVGIDKRQLRKTIGRIQKSIKNKEKIVVFGDYDVDGICGSAILWETLNGLGASVMPYIPHRMDEGYGLSMKAIQNSEFRIQNIKLIITVDNGIVANEAVKYAKDQGIDVIITDHHVPSKKLPDAFAIVHTTKLCGAGVAWVLSSVILNSFQNLNILENKTLKQVQGNNNKNNLLELVALATIADLVSLLGANRILVKFGLEALRRTKRVGLLELLKEAVLEKDKIGVYEIGHIIAPRLNAMGRLEYAMDSLRLLCTKNRDRARMLAQTLGSTNRERQARTLTTVKHAKSAIQNSEFRIQNLLFVAHESYQQGVIGLVAGKLVEEYYRPTIVVSKGEIYSKASARSINGFNIIEFIRSASEYLVDAGGHPMAAGFTVETSKLALVQKTLENKAESLLDEEKLTRTLRIDCELDLSLVNNKLYDAIQKLAPFGMGNPEPTFVGRGVEIQDIRTVGREAKHLKLQLVCHPEALAKGSHEILRFAQNDKGMIDGIAFGMGEKYSQFHVGDAVDIAYTVDENKWNGNKKLQLKIKDLKLSRS
ncbi:MAG: single-stranded-DNA-specific exonuclease RecJ [Patescibacteria group bacterium]